MQLSVCTEPHTYGPARACARLLACAQCKYWWMFPVVDWTARAWPQLTTTKTTMRWCDDGKIVVRQPISVSLSLIFIFWSKMTIVIRADGDGAGRRIISNCMIDGRWPFAAQSQSLDALRRNEISNDLEWWRRRRRAAAEAERWFTDARLALAGDEETIKRRELLVVHKSCSKMVKHAHRRLALTTRTRQRMHFVIKFFFLLLFFYVWHKTVWKCSYRTPYGS